MAYPDWRCGLALVAAQARKASGPDEATRACSPSGRPARSGRASSTYLPISGSRVAGIPSASLSISALNASHPSLRMAYFMRAWPLFRRLPVRSKTRTTASQTGISLSGGRNSCSTQASCGDTDNPPPITTLKPISFRPSFSRVRAMTPMSCIAPRAQSEGQPEKEILNLRGRAWQIGFLRKKRVTASPYGVTSNGSVVQTPAMGQAVMLRTVLPQASRVVRPVRSRASIASGTTAILTKWNCTFWRVVTCPKPRE